MESSSSSTSSSPSSSLKRRLKSMCGGCFKQLDPLHNNNKNNNRPNSDSSSLRLEETSTATVSSNQPLQCRNRTRSLRRSSTMEVRACRTSNDIKHKYRHIINRIGTPRSHRKSHSIAFRYDPSSYALNFDQDDHQFPPRSFAARLPPSPTEAQPMTAPAHLASVAPRSSSSNLEITAHRKPILKTPQLSVLAID